MTSFVEIRQRTDSEKIDWLIGQMALLMVQEETREKKMDAILTEFDQINIRLKRIEDGIR